MKRLLLLICLTSFLWSCENDDDTVVIQCTTPSSLNVSSISDNSATITWQDNANAISYDVEYGLSGFVQGNGTMTTSTTNSINIAGLNENTTYDIYVKAVCSATNESSFSAAFSFTTNAEPVIAQLLPNLSDLKLFDGDLADLIPNPNAFEYQLVTPLFSDYAHKLRFIALPQGEAMNFNGDGFPDFPNGTLISKTFYYNNNELDLSQGRKIIETRILIRENNMWTIGNYLWNDDQTDAVLDDQTHIVPVSWINEQGENMSTDYVVPNQSACITCHSTAGETTIIGPRLRTMNFDVGGMNQLQRFIDNGALVNAPSPSSIGALPDWEDTSLTLDQRTRAYFDVNCAHCHSDGGMCEIQSTLRLQFETSFEDSKIFENRASIIFRTQEYVEGFSMPFIGTTLHHTEGFALIQEYIDSLE